MFFPLAAIQNILQHFIGLHNIFLQFKEKFDADVPHFQVCHFLSVENVT
jgi:hypothetical protein